MDIHELAAGKLTALIDRSLGRDLFDAHFLFSTNCINFEILRPIFVAYLGISNQKNIRSLTVEQIAIDFKELQHKLLPMLANNKLNYTENKNMWAKEMLVAVQKSLQALLPLRENDIAFLDALLDFGEIKSEMITNDLLLQKNIKLHPALHWTVFNTQRNRTK